MTSATSKISQGAIEFGNCMRDSMQALFGTKPPAQRMAAAQKHATERTSAGHGWAYAQTGGGTFYGVFTDQDRDVWEQINILTKAFDGLPQTALIRNDCLLGYNRCAQWVIDDLVLEMARSGTLRLQNFHGLNDTRTQVAVAQATAKARATPKSAEEGGGYYEIYAQGTINFEDNPNLTIEKALVAADELIASGHRDIYLKCANGKAQPDYVYKLVKELKERHPDQKIYIHTHDTYGLSEAIYMAAIEGAVDSAVERATETARQSMARGETQGSIEDAINTAVEKALQEHLIGLDVLPPYLAGNTAQPSALRMHELIATHPDPRIQKLAPKLNWDAIEKDEKAGLELRHQYRDAELKYVPRLLETMFKAGAAGGASATLRGIPDMEKNLRSIFPGFNWEDIMCNLYEREIVLSELLGHPTTVTPYANMKDKQAAVDLVALRGNIEGLPVSLTPDAKDYLTGGLGAVPDSVHEGLRKPQIPFVSADELNPDIPGLGLKNPTRQQIEDALYERLKAAGCDRKPTKREMITVGMLKTARAVDFVIRAATGKLNPAPEPPLPKSFNYPRHDGVSADDLFEYSLVKNVLGMADLEKLAQAVLEVAKAGYYKTHIPGDFRIKGMTNAGFDDAKTVARGQQRNAHLQKFFVSQTQAAKRYVGDFVEGLPDRLEKAGFYAQHLPFILPKIQSIIEGACMGKGEVAACVPKINPALFRNMPKYSNSPVVSGIQTDRSNPGPFEVVRLGFPTFTKAVNGNGAAPSKTAASAAMPGSSQAPYLGLVKN